MEVKHVGKNAIWRHDVDVSPIRALKNGSNGKGIRFKMCLSYTSF